MREQPDATPHAAPDNGDGEDEEFYESLDRILSSSCSSTSASDDDDNHHQYHRHRRRGGVHNFARLSAALLDSYEVWTSDPAPVQERRRRLLQQLGLSGDPSLSRIRSDFRSDEASPFPCDGSGEMGRSVSFDGVCPCPSADASVISTAIARSRSDSSVDQTAAAKIQHQQLLSPSFGLPPRQRPSFGENSCDSERDNDPEPEEERLRRTIRNLDNGEEFVVKEVQEDGMWGQLKEMGTGRQLTMEEFEMCVGRSPIVQELMRRQTREGCSASPAGSADSTSSRSSGAQRCRKRGGWLRSIRNVVQRDRRSSDERDTSSEKGGRRSSSATDDSQDGSHFHHCPERIKVRHYGKSHKELTGLYLSQEIQAHNGSIWSVKFSTDGKYLASAGEDCVIHVWEVSEYERREEFLLERDVVENGNCNPFFAVISNGSPDPLLALSCAEANHWEKKRRSKVPGSRKSVSLDHLMVPEHAFALKEKPVRSFKGHLADVLDLSWSKSQYLLSSSMDKTVRLWHMSSNSCLKVFAHSDFVTCIQFNPVDDRYFISGSLDEKVRIWSIPDRQVVDWTDLHEMVTAACYSPDGQGALVGTHKGSCHMYDTSDNKLQQKNQIDLQNKKKRSHHKKITGFQFAPGSSSEVIVTSADSRIRVIDGVELVHKFKGFRNTSSQISASLTANGKYIICASEDSQVYMWKHDTDARPSQSKGFVSLTQAYEHFHCPDVTVAVTWSNTCTRGTPRSQSRKQDQPNGACGANQEGPAQPNCHESSPMYAYINDGFTQHESSLSTNMSLIADRFSATWPEEKLLATSNKHYPQSNGELLDSGLHVQSRTAWGLVIVTAGRGGEIRAFQNFGFPVRL